MKKIKQFLKFGLFFTICFSMIFSAFSPCVSATEETTEKTDYYELKKLDDGTYSLVTYGNVDWSILSKYYVTVLNINDCKLKDLTQLPQKDSLLKLSLNNCQIKTLNGVEKFGFVNTLNLLDSTVEDISKISLLENLTSLSLSYKDVTDLGNYPNLKNIEEYYFKNCNFKDLTQLPHSSVLKQATFYRCNMESIDGIERFTSLETLYFSSVGLEDISQISSLVNLVDVAFEFAHIKDLTPLESLPKLEILDIDECLRLESLAPIKNMPSLKQLLAINCQMALTEDTLQYIKDKKLKTNLTEKDLQVKNDVIALCDSLKLQDKTDEEKIRIVTQYVIDIMEYDFSASLGSEDNIIPLWKYNDDALYYALKGQGCCQNYTALISVLLLQAGVDTYECKSENHIWNLVKLENEYYWIDATWIDVLDKGVLENSKDYMTQSELFLEEHPCVSFPVSYYIEKNQEVENQEAPQEDATENKSQIIVAIGALLLVGLFLGPQKKKSAKK